MSFLNENANCSQRFDTKLKKIEAVRTRLQVARCNFAVCRDQSKVYILGGFGQSKGGAEEDAYTRSVEIFDLEDGTVKDGKRIPVADQAFTACFV